MAAGWRGRAGVGPPAAVRVAAVADWDDPQEEEVFLSRCRFCVVVVVLKSGTVPEPAAIGCKHCTVW